MADATAAEARARTLDALERMAATAGAGAPTHARAVPRRPSRRRARGVGTTLRTNLTPMIDVVFLLLIFYMATTRWGTDERVIAMDLERRTAEAAAGDGPAPPRPPERDPFVLDDESLRLEVAADGTVTAGAPLRRAFRAEELRASLTAEIRLPGRAGGMFEPAFPIVIAPAENAPWEAAVETLDAAVAAGFRNVGFERRPGSAGAGRR
jgi:biopolymer transport protein ExbD